MHTYYIYIYSEEMREDLPFEFKYPNNPNLETIKTDKHFSHETNPRKLNVEAKKCRLQYTGSDIIGSPMSTTDNRQQSIPPASSSLSTPAIRKLVNWTHGGNKFVNKYSVAKTRALKFGSDFTYWLSSDVHSNSEDEKEWMEESVFRKKMNENQQKLQNWMKSKDEWLDVKQMYITECTGKTQSPEDYYKYGSNYDDIIKIHRVK